MSPVDCVYVAASERDARFTRTCVASIRYFHPDVPIRILPGERLESALLTELRRHWDVTLAKIGTGAYGWGFVKLEPLFGQSGERFMVVDSDTVFTGPVLDAVRSKAPFVVDDEVLSESDAHRLYYDGQKVREIDPAVPDPRGAFNTGQWFGTAGLLSRDDFEPWVDFSFPRRLRYPDRFMGGDQGVLNCVLLKKEANDGLLVERQTIMRWPGHSLDGLDVESVAARTAPPCVIHWAGMKTVLFRNSAGSDLLLFFERLYYQSLPAPRVRRAFDNCRHVCRQWKHYIRVRLTLACRKWLR